ncbi:glycosyl hydrolase family 28-related protein [Paenibacillus hexagrammi]|uniref:CBM6 domain-containing protein n=1 Tax=Paenibacillus hexagrammi TaxID=2908839 RepID=A0ABY3SIE8_9BACL|nr:glycosyl hydrolase family 28-related protein [Paenibacillus sp. YPD9-1]UJF33788.1 hypothetical protein L0M14_00510 [Paenibacillus sp. YPD9-1]
MKLVIKKLILLWMALLLIIPAPASVYGAEDSGGGANTPEGYVRIKNKWLGTYLYEDSSQVVRYGFTSITDPSSEWIVESASGSSSNKRIKNRATGHYITMDQVNGRRTAVTTADGASGTLSDQWMIEDASRPGYVTIRTATTPNVNNFIHVEDQLSFAEVSSDIGAIWESPQWKLEPVNEAAPVRIVNKFREGQYLYEDKDGLVEFGKVPLNDATSHWYIESVHADSSGITSVRIQNRSTGHYITQGVFYDKIQSLPAADSKVNQWIMADGTEQGWVTFTNVDALDQSSNYVLNTQFDDTFVRSNDWPTRDSVPPQQNDNAQWKIEPAADVAPVRIAAFTEHQLSDTYLYEDNSMVKYGAWDSSSVTSSVYYQWLVEDYNGNKRIKNMATGSYMSVQDAVYAANPLLSLPTADNLGGDQWRITPSAIYDDYVTVQNAVYSSANIHITDNLGFVQASPADPNTNPAQWLFEDPNAASAATQYVQIQNEWQSLSMYEDDNGDLKYGNVKADDYRGQWLIERFAGRKRIQNRATGHYINIQDMSGGHIRVTDVEDSWNSAVWVVETLSGGAKLIHSVNDSNSDINHQKFIHLQNLLKYAEYGEINRSWGSPHWKFIPVTDDSAKFYLLKNKATGAYFYEEITPGVENGKVKYGDIDPHAATAQWYMEDAGGGPQYIRNRATGHYIAMEGVDPSDDGQSTPLQSMNVDLSWGIASPKWFIENAPADGYKVIRSGWTGEHYINVKDQTGYAQSNKQVADQDSAQFAFEQAPEVPIQLPQGFVRIKNTATNQYLYENNRGIVMYGTPEANNGYAHWSIESAGGWQRLKNRATGHYMVLNPDYTYIQSEAADVDDEASRWAVESNNGGSTYLIHSTQNHFNDEYVNVQNGLGYPERGLYPNQFATLQWNFEQASDDFVTPSSDEARNEHTHTTIFNDTNYSKIVNKKTKQSLYEKNGAALSTGEEQSDFSDQWMIQDFNGRKLLQNRATGHLLSASPNQAAVLTNDTDPVNPTSQWVLQDELGYMKVVNAAQQLHLYEAQDDVRLDKLSNAEQGSADWMIVPVPGEAVYEAEDAFISGGVHKADSIASFTGTGYVDDFSADGAKVIFGVNAQEGQEYDATLRYQNPADTAEQLTVYVNGLHAEQITFDAGNGSDEWKTMDLNLQLRAGYNSVTVEAGGSGSGQIAIDSLTLHNAVNKAYRGAIQPYITYEAEYAVTNGSLIGPSRTYREVANEASGRKAVKLDQAGQYVKFTTAKQANSIVLRYAIPDSASGTGIQTTLGLYVNDVKVKDLKLTSKYAWEYGNYPWSNDPQQGSAHRFFDEVHALIGDVPAGAEITLKNDANTADYYIIDFAELEQVDDQPYEQPQGFLSVTDFGAVAGDGQDDSDAFQAAMDAAKAQRKGVWFPAGAYELDNGGQLFMLDNVTIRGAGMWHTTLKGAKFYGIGSHIRVYDLFLDGELNVRDDEAHTNGFEGAFGPGSTIQSVWIEHTKTAMWIARAKPQFGFNSDIYTNEFYVAGLRMRNLMADGINFSINTKNSMVEQSNVRYPGDDGLAMWSTLTTGYPDDFTENNTFRFDTVQLPWLSNNMVVFGGKDNNMQDNVLSDTIGLGGGSSSRRGSNRLRSAEQLLSSEIR